MVRRRALLIGSIAGVVVAAVTVWSLVTTPVYDATATLFVSIRGAAPGTDLQLVQAERSDSYAELATSRTVLNAAAGSADVTRSPEELESGVSAVHPQNSVLIHVTARDEDADQAAAIANAVALETTRRVEELETPVGQQISPIRVSVAQAARAPSSPTSPKVMRNILVAIFGGLLFGLVAGILREMFDRRLRDPVQIRDQFDLPVLTAVDFDRRMKGRSMLINYDDVNAETIPQESLAEVWRHSHIVEEFRQLRTGLQFFEFGDRPSVMVTSSAPGEGKTTTAGNLAITSALAGESVVVVDCDLRRPTMGSQLDVKSEHGLTDVLIGKVDLDTALADGRRLSVLPSGPVPPNPTELLGSQAMADLMEELHRRFQRVVIDTPPCLPFADASVLAPLCGATLLVVRMGSTTDEQLERSVVALTTARARICGVSANMVTSRGGGSYGYYYYDRGGYGAGSTDDLSPSGFGNLKPRGARERV